MKIITVPHPTLRQSAQPIISVDKKLRQLLQDLGETLIRKDNPRGVGLAAPQVNESWRLFATLLPPSGRRGDGQPQLRLFLNPRIVDTSPQLTFGENPDEPILEGCLSIPEIYGPVPRYQWVELSYDQVEGDQLVTHQQRFTEYAARVIQHEYDHLDGRLFIDYAVEYDLPLYRENGKKMDEMSSQMVKAFHHQSLIEKK